MTYKKAAFSIVIIAITASMIFGGCFFNRALSNDDNLDTHDNREPICETTEFMLDTVVNVKIYDVSRDGAFKAKERDTLANDAMNVAIKKCSELEKILSRTIKDSDVDKINNASGTPTQVRPSTAHVLTKAQNYAELSGGLFDISIGKVSAMWLFGAKVEPKDKIAPADVLIQEALPTIDYHGVELLDTVVTLVNPESQIDLGGIAKGYIADQMAETLKDEGVTSAIVDLGGNVKTVGLRQNHSYWKVGVKNPFATEIYPEERAVIDYNKERKGNQLPAGSMIGILEIDSDESVGTSGTYERYFFTEKNFYHHILDPKTGYPAMTDLAAVTVVSKYAVDGEGYSTPAIIMGYDKAIKWLQEQHVKAVLVKTDGTITTVGDIRFDKIG